MINDNNCEGFPNLKNALINFFSRHTYGILTANLTSVALYCNNQQRSDTTTFYWLFDSHSRGPKGYKAPSRGVSCCMRFNNIDDFYKILRRNLYAKSGDSNILNTYSLTPITIVPENTPSHLHEKNIISPTPQLTELPNSHTCKSRINSNSCPPIDKSHTASRETEIVFTTSMLHCIDKGVPDVENLVSVDNNDLQNDRIRLADIHRKTAPPLNLERERRMEELSWYFLFPDGKNGFGEQRDISITPLDYFQARVMGNDKRFQRTDYLFFALSVVEYYRAKSSVSVSCRMQQGERTPQGLVDNMHLTMRNVRESASYWRRCCAELIAMIRSLGPPTWFLTFSCNDLNWSDILAALLIVDGRNPSEAKNLTFAERLALVQQYPVVLARQFMVRMNALIRFLKHNSMCLGGPVQDFWYRIEFQNRGSPHLHMLVWCTNVPDFSTNKGINLIETVVSCSLNQNDELFRNLVESV